MLDSNNNYGAKRPLTEEEKKMVESELQKMYMENTICTFVFGILGCILPVFLFSIMGYTYSKKQRSEKLVKLHKIGTILCYVGLIMSSALIIFISVYNRFFA